MAHATNTALASRDARPEAGLSSAVLATQFGAALTLLLALQFLSASTFFLYVFKLDIGPYFTATRFVHFYAGLASIPYIAGHLLAASVRFSGYYLRVERYHSLGPPPWPRRLLGPLLALDFAVLYGSGLYMLFHVYYHTTNLPPFGLFPVQTHLWASIVAVPLVSAHIGLHLVDVLRGIRRTPVAERALPVNSGPAVMQRRALFGAVALGALGLSFGLQNTRLQRGAGIFFISRKPPGEDEGPGAFPTETLFGVDTEIDTGTWRLVLAGAVPAEVSLSYDDLLAMPAVERDIRLSCVSGWTANATWRGPLVRDVLAMAGADGEAAGVRFESVTNYGVTWARHRVESDAAILATHVNGAPLSAYHGFPVRLIVPGYPGQDMVKQLRRIALVTNEPSFDPGFKLVADPHDCSPSVRTA